MADGTDYYIGKFITAYCTDGRTFHGTLLNIDKYGNIDIVGKESPESDKMKFTILRQHLIAVGTVLEKII